MVPAAEYAAQVVSGPYTLYSVVFLIVALALLALLVTVAAMAGSKG